MVVANRITLALLVSGLALVGYAQQKVGKTTSVTTRVNVTYRQSSLSPRVRDMLVRAFDQKTNKDVVMLVVYTSTSTGEQEQHKLMRSRDGKVHRIWLQPLSRAGMEMVDDGRQIQTYFKDINTIMVTTSSGDKVTGARRIGLVERNYTIDLEDDFSYLGRDAYRLVAIPRFAEMDQRTMVIDAQTGLFLRLDVGKGKAAKPRLQVQSLSTTEKLNSQSFQLNKMDAERRQYAERRNLDMREARRAMGIRPVEVDNLPFGFEVLTKEMELEQSKAVVFRFSDGLSNGTLYQLARLKDEAKVSSDLLRRDVGKLTFLLQVDASNRIREQLMDEIVRQATESTQNAVLNPMAGLLFYLGTPLPQNDVAKI
ncbi:MAG: hypothetical protein JST35_10775 [Armatimonadetes bacterium]|nr:hypothetical protein [Armatimonadota bacterium]